MEIKRRMTKQRSVIYEYLKAHKTHPTANDVYQALVKEHPEMSLATVYRNLNLLADMGMLQKITMPSAPDRFDGDLSPHYHFLCTKCGDIHDIFISYDKDLDALARENTPHEVFEHEVYFKGICSNCKGTQS